MRARSGAIGGVYGRRGSPAEGVSSVCVGNALIVLIASLLAVMFLGPGGPTGPDAKLNVALKTTGIVGDRRNDVLSIDKATNDRDRLPSERTRISGRRGTFVRRLAVGLVLSLILSPFVYGNGVATHTTSPYRESSDKMSVEMVSIPETVSIPPWTGPNVPSPVTNPYDSANGAWKFPSGSYLSRPESGATGWPNPTSCTRWTTVEGDFFGWDGNDQVKPLSFQTAWVWEVDYDVQANTPFMSRFFGAYLLNSAGHLRTGSLCNQDANSEPSSGTADIVVAVVPISSAAHVIRYYSTAIWDLGSFVPLLYTAWTPQINNIPDGTANVGRWIVPQNTNVRFASTIYSLWSGVLAGWDLVSNRLTPVYVPPKVEIHFPRPLFQGGDVPNKEPFSHYHVMGAKCGWTRPDNPFDLFDRPNISDCAPYWHNFHWQIHIDSTAAAKNAFVINHLYGHYVMQRLFGGAYPSNGATEDQSSRFAGDFDENGNCDASSGAISFQLYCDKRFTIFYSDLDSTYGREVAWAEAWADYFALRAIGGSSTIQFQRSAFDSSCPNCAWSINFEPVYTPRWGAQVEYNVLAALNDMFDSSVDHLDSIAVPSSDIWRAFAATFSKSLAYYWRQFRSTFASDISKVYGSRLAIFNNNIDYLTDLRLTQNTAASVSPVVAAEGSNFHVVWVDARNGNNEIYYKKVDSNWNVVVGDTRLTSNSADSVSPSVGVGLSGRVEVIWSDKRNGNYEIYKRTYTPSGGWGAETRLTTTAPDSKEPDVAFDSSGNALYAWREVQRTSTSETESIQHSRNGGSATLLDSFVGAALAATHTDRMRGPSITSGGTGYVHVVWSRGPAWPAEFGTTDLYYRRWTGSAWASRFTLGQDQDAPRTIRIDAAGATVVTVWDQWQNGFDISYRTSSDYGASWAAEAVITKSAYQFAPDVAINPANGDWYVTYADNSLGQYEVGIFARARLLPPPFPAAIIGPIQASDFSGDSLYPRIAWSAAAGRFSVAWHDVRDGNSEVYWFAKDLPLILFSG